MEILAEQQSAKYTMQIHWYMIMKCLHLKTLFIKVL